MPKVTLLAHTAHPEQLVAAAAKLCYSPVGVDELLDGLDEKKSADFVELLSSYGHESPIEHANFTFALEGVSRALLAQITRHRLASFSVQSQRYVAENNFGYVTPPQIAQDPEALAAFREAMEQAGRSYEKIAALLQRKAEQALLNEGKSPKEAKSAAEKTAIEDARFVLPNACDTKMILTMNARSLHNFFRLRCCRRAQWEIRGVAEEMLRLACGVAPTLFSGAGPACVRGGCPEGSKSCGDMVRVREWYRDLKEAAKSERS